MTEDRVTEAEKAFRAALEDIAREASYCDDCAMHGDVTLATKETRDLVTGEPVLLCDDCAENLRELRMDQDGASSPFEDFEQEYEHAIALRALGMLPERPAELPSDKQRPT